MARVAMSDDVIQRGRTDESASGKGSSAAGKSNPVSTWFTWCQVLRTGTAARTDAAQECKHGGHSDHIEEWFADHDRCPVADCACACSALDPL